MRNFATELIRLLKGRKDKTDVGSLDDVIDYLANGTHTHSVTLMRLRNNTHLRHKIEKLLDEEGFRSLSYDPKMGRVANLFDITENQLLRITDEALEPPRPDTPEVLQPIISKTVIAHFAIVVVPKVNVAIGVDYEFDADGGVTVTENQNSDRALLPEHVILLVQELAKKGHFFWDAKLENIGLLKDGTPVVTDGGAVVDMDRMDEIFYDGKTYKQAFADKINARKPKDEWKGADETLKEIMEKKVAVPEGRWDGSWDDVEVPKKRTISYDQDGWLIEGDMQETEMVSRQQLQLEALNLKKGKVRGIVTKKEFDSLVDVRGGEEGVITGLIRKNRMYRERFEQAAEIATTRFIAGLINKEEAIERGDKEIPEVKPWLELLKEEAEVVLDNRRERRDAVVRSSEQIDAIALNEARRIARGQKKRFKGWREAIEDATENRLADKDDPLVYPRK